MRKREGEEGRQRKRQCLRVSTTEVNHHDQKQLGLERVCFSSQLSGHAASLRGQDRNLESEAEAEPRKSAED